VIKDFKTFVNEALTVRSSLTGVKDTHFEERAKLRLKGLKIVNFLDDSGKNVDVDPKVKSASTRFFQEVFFHLADPEKSKIFDEVDVPLGMIGLIRMGKPVVVLPNGKKVKPVFEVYERTDQGKKIMRTGLYFWIFTIGSTVRTIKLYTLDGSNQSERNTIINKSIDHLRFNKEAELARISRVLNVRMENPEDLKQKHKVVLKPAGIDEVTFDLSLPASTEQQLTDFIAGSTVTRQEQVYIAPERGTTDFTLETVPKQMNITPNKVWILERNEKHNTWGAIPIEDSQLVKRGGDNEIAMKIGKKWVHWLDEPRFNPPVPTNERFIRKGDTITLAKQLGSGQWLANTGTIREISIDPKSAYPYAKTAGWDKTEIIPADLAERMFKDYRLANESRFVMSFNEWIDHTTPLSTRLNEEIVIDKEIPEMDQFLEIVCNPDGSLKYPELFTRLQGGNDNPKLREQIKKMYLDTSTRKNKKAKYSKEARTVIEMVWELTKINTDSEIDIDKIIPETILDPTEKQADGTYPTDYKFFVFTDLNSKAIDYLTGERSGIATGFMGLMAR
jgi:hypothetical protein